MPQMSSLPPLSPLHPQATLEPWGPLHDIAKEVRAKLKTGFEGRDCLFLAYHLARRLRDLGYDAKLGAGWGVWRYGPGESEAVGSVPAWMAIDGHIPTDGAGLYSGHTWVEVDGFIVDGTGFSVPSNAAPSPATGALKVMVFRKNPATFDCLRAVAKSRSAPGFAYLSDADCLVFVEMMLTTYVPGAVLDDLIFYG